jgi:pyruvate formate-lyase activating enzyme-like uncharacterized protein
MQYNNHLNKHSTGCQLCQKGKWLCIFITYKCSADCAFCPAPLSNDTIQSAFGNTKEQVLQYLKTTSFKGISYSGGDPFLVYDRMLEWQQYFYKHLPHYYYWVYTNGLTTNPYKLEKLANTGVNEIRFNIAATSYLNNNVWKQIKLARKYFKYVSIEIPSIKAHQPKLIKALKQANSMGIDFLNLHDYIVSENNPSKAQEPIKEFTLNFTDELYYVPSSILNTQEIISHCEKEAYAFKINHCSMQQKEEQMLQRRLNTGQIFLNSDIDIHKDNGTVVNYFRFPSALSNENISTILFMQPEKHHTYLISKLEAEHTLELNNKLLGFLIW